MRAAELRKLGSEDLKKKLEEARKDLFNLRFKHAVGQLEKSSRLREARRDVARLLTLLGEQEG